ncbi:hypothetical protein CWO08_08405 [Vibrio sp. 10N.286.48.B8]|uniref:glycosyltransferase n=1 Tax=Vibrio sp. 10N.286.48.B8 TaxID=2056189 RepID=UPI000D33A929|nr:glycosyltransferase [Vibrio sp. 10N.286.48.B8]PTO96263.1 hypothetical protein CWO08_08405 [Vibrio sp. 10N.286.48.B8]
MKVISVDFNPILYKGGIASFNQRLSDAFGDDIYFITYFSGNRILRNETNFHLPKKIFKFVNALFRYNFSSFLLYIKLLTISEKSQITLILNSPSFIKILPGGFKKIILVQHQDSQTMWENRSGFNKSKRLLEKCKARLTYLVSLTENDKIEFHSRYNIPFNNIIVISHCAGIEKLLSSKEKSKNILMMSRLDNNQKRIDLAIQAMTKLPDWTLNIYGIGEDEVLLKKIVSQLRLNNVKFHGLSEDKMSAFDSNAIHIMTSDFEGFGISNIEALTRGLPLIIRDTFPASREIISNNNGILLHENWDENEFVNSVRELYTNYSDFSDNALRSSEKYTLEKFKAKWIEICK